MSRVGKKPVAIPGGVTVSVSGQRVEVSGPKGKLDWSAPAAIRMASSADGKSVEVTRQDDLKSSRALHGLSRSLVANMIEGVSRGYQKRLLIYGTGYGCNVSGKTLDLNVGFMGRGTKETPQFRVPIPEGVQVKAEVPAARGDSEPARILIEGCDKQKVGQFAATVRRIRPPEPYKGKGIRYSDEHVKRKQGKALAGGR